MPRLVHHLVYPTILSKRPVACGESFEEAKARGAIFPDAMVILHIAHREHPSDPTCPVCGRANR